MEPGLAWNIPRKFIPPRDFHEVLNERMVGQPELKVKLASAFSHYTAFLEDPSVGKPMTLVYGPSGAGKTYGIELCCEVSGLDMTVLGGGGISPAGYKGTTLRDLLSQHYKQFRQSEGVIFLDEIDKWCRGYLAQYGNADQEAIAVGLSKQAESLRYVEHELIDFIDEGKDVEELKHQTFDTGRTFWIFAGAFVGINRVIMDRTGHQQIQPDEIWEYADPTDFKKYGMMEEFANRVGIWAWAKELTTVQLQEILASQDRPKWIRLFDMVGCRLDLQDSALTAAASVAMESRRGPRGAKELLSRTLGDAYTQVSINSLSHVVIDAQVMTHGRLLVDAV